jgi:uncharacterized membrane protein YkgB
MRNFGMDKTSVTQNTVSPIASVGESSFIRRLPLEYASWLGTHDVPFLVCSVGMIVMLLWAGSYKMTAPGADSIVPLVLNNPLIAWQFNLFGTYHGADLIGATEWTAALLLLSGYLWPRAGILGGVMATMMFLITSSMLLTTPGTITIVHGKPYMSLMGLFLYKDVLSLGVALYLPYHGVLRSHIDARTLISREPHFA